MDLSHAVDRDVLRERLAQPFVGRPVMVGPGVLAGSTPTVRMLLGIGAARVLVLATGRGAGELPAEDEATVLFIDAPPADLVTDELRAQEALVRNLPADVVEAVERFDPDREAVWLTSPFVTVDEPLLGRPVYGGRPAAWLALEDKVLAEDIWAAAGIAHAPSAVVPVDATVLAAATSTVAGELGAVWAGDARDGFNGAGNYVRWVIDEADQRAALEFFAPRCDRVRVQPFLDGMPCSIHGMVLADGTATFRPVEIAILRNIPERRFVYGGLATHWDPPEADRAAMREVARRVGERLRAAYSYRGMFGVDGVLTAEGFLPTEINTRMSAGASTVTAAVDSGLFTLLQAHLVAGIDPGVGVDIVETAVGLMDAARTGRAVAVGEGHAVGAADEFPVSFEDGSLTRADHDTGNTLVLSDTPTGFFAKIDPCLALRPGERLAPLNQALMAFLDREYGAQFGPLTAAPSLR